MNYNIISMIRTGLFIWVFFAATASFAQGSFGARRYFDSSWRPAAKDTAFYYADARQEKNVYKEESYYAASGKLQGTATFTDPMLRKGIGIKFSYYETGELKDSGLFDPKEGYLADVYTFRKNGKLEKHLNSNHLADVYTTEFYDEEGKLDPKATRIQIPAKFNGGIPAWTKYLQRNLILDIAARNRAPVGQYTVVVAFVINKEGKVDEVVADRDPGYGTKEEAIRVVRNSPKWMPATQNGEPVIYRHKQSITFQVSEQ
jgi:hypothetical protein